MFPEAIQGVVVLLLFVVRIAVPIAFTLAFGHWLERKLRPQEEPAEIQAQVKQVRQASNIIHLHCWDLKRCNAAGRVQCAAYQHPDLPCWLAIQVEGGQVHEQCFTCAFYKPQTIAA